jgi:hypothetical protein
LRKGKDIECRITNFELRIFGAIKKDYEFDAEYHFGVVIYFKYYFMPDTHFFFIDKRSEVNPFLMNFGVVPINL